MKRPILAALALAALAAPAAAQQAHREGWWAEAAGGYGYLRVGTQSQQVRRQTGTSWYLRVGRQLGHNVSAGLEASTYTGSADTMDAHVSSLQAIAVFNPWSRIPFFLQGGFGITDGLVQVTVPPGQVYEATGTGMGLSFGASYDIHVGRRLSITPTVATHISALGDFIFSPTQKADDVIATAYLVGVGVTWR
jgi:hypothetical protein